MTHFYTCGQIPIGASTGFNLYSPTIVRGMKESEIQQMVKDFGTAVNLARKAGFDAVEIHAGHGYLISQFFIPLYQKRKDKYGGSIENRMRFMQMVMKEVMHAAGDDMAVMVKVNMYDGFKSGMQLDECLLVAKELERLGVHALVLSAGFVSKAPMHVMRGAMPIKTMAHYRVGSVSGGFVSVYD
jgi:2,4-dienoyl-CoA reductase-like NADH-dependent reductase (Old Yellow Enzyme family)